MDLFYKNKTRKSLVYQGGFTQGGVKIHKVSILIIFTRLQRKLLINLIRLEFEVKLSFQEYLLAILLSAIFGSTHPSAHKIWNRFSQNSEVDIGPIERPIFEFLSMRNVTQWNQLKQRYYIRQFFWYKFSYPSYFLESLKSSISIRLD
jgi:hypothetical protein